MKKMLYVLLCFAGVLSGCGAKTAVVEDVKPFRHVFFMGNKRTDMLFSQSADCYQVGIGGISPDSVRMDVRHDTLYIDIDYTNCRPTLCLTAPCFVSVNASFARSVRTLGTIRQDSIRFDLPLCKKADLALDVRKLVVGRHSISDHLTLSGRADTVYLNCLNEITLDAMALAVKEMHLSAVQSVARLNVTEQLWLDNVVNSNIIYVGAPTIMECRLLLSSVKNMIEYTWKNKLFDKL